MSPSCFPCAADNGELTQSLLWILPGSCGEDTLPEGLISPGLPHFQPACVLSVARTWGGKNLSDVPRLANDGICSPVGMPLLLE